MKTTHITFYSRNYTIIQRLDDTIEVVDYSHIYGNPIDFHDLSPQLQAQLLTALEYVEDQGS